MSSTGSGDLAGIQNVSKVDRFPLRTISTLAPPHTTLPPPHTTLSPPHITLSASHTSLPLARSTFLPPHKTLSPPHTTFSPPYKTHGAVAPAVPVALAPLATLLALRTDYFSLLLDAILNNYWIRLSHDIKSYSDRCECYLPK